MITKYDSIRAKGLGVILDEVEPERTREQWQAYATEMERRYRSSMESHHELVRVCLATDRLLERANRFAKVLGYSVIGLVAVILWLAVWR